MCACASSSGAPASPGGSPRASLCSLRTSSEAGLCSSGAGSCCPGEAWGRRGGGHRAQRGSAVRLGRPTGGPDTRILFLDAPRQGVPGPRPGVPASEPPMWSGTRGRSGASTCGRPSKSEAPFVETPQCPETPGFGTRGRDTPSGDLLQRLGAGVMPTGDGAGSAAGAEARAQGSQPGRRPGRLLAAWAFAVPARHHGTPMPAVLGR